MSVPVLLGPREGLLQVAAGPGCIPFCYKGIQTPPLASFSQTHKTLHRLPVPALLPLLVKPFPWAVGALLTSTFFQTLEMPLLQWGSCVCRALSLEGLSRSPPPYTLTSHITPSSGSPNDLPS